MTGRCPRTRRSRWPRRRAWRACARRRRDRPRPHRAPSSTTSPCRRSGPWPARASPGRAPNPAVVTAGRRHHPSGARAARGDGDADGPLTKGLEVDHAGDHDHGAGASSTTRSPSRATRADLAAGRARRHPRQHHAAGRGRVRLGDQLGGEPARRSRRPARSRGPPTGARTSPLTLTATLTKGAATETKTFAATRQGQAAQPRIPERYFLGYFTGEGLADGEQLRFATLDRQQRARLGRPRRRQAVAGVPARRPGPARPVHHPLARRRHLLHDRHGPELVQPQPRLPDQRQPVHRGLRVPRPRQLVAAAARQGRAGQRRQRVRARGLLGRLDRRVRRLLGAGDVARPGQPHRTRATSRCGTRPRATSARSRRPRCGRTRTRSRASTRP